MIEDLEYEGELGVEDEQTRLQEKRYEKAVRSKARAKALKDGFVINGIWFSEDTALKFIAKCSAAQLAGKDSVKWKDQNRENVMIEDYTVLLGQILETLDAVYAEYE